MAKIVLFVLGVILLFASCGTDNIQLEKSKIDEKQYPYDQHFIDKNFPNKTPDLRAYDSALKEIKNGIQEGRRSSGSWEVQGPGNIGGRINTVAVDPTDENIIFAGFSDGGVFRTKNGGQSWSPIFDEQARLSIGSIEIDPSNPNVIYVGTGDPNISGFPLIGDGIYKSTDGGDTWNNIGLEDERIISRIHVDAEDGNIVYASAMGLPFEKNQSRGVYKSFDGGSSWEQVLFVNDSTGIIDMIVQPDNPDIVYAVGWNRIRSDKQSRVSGPDAKVHKTTDGGQTWEILAGGLPHASFGRLGLAMSETNTNVLYALYTTGTQFYGIYKTENSGQTWTKVSDNMVDGLSNNPLGGFAWYFGQIRINPADDNDIFLLGVEMYRSKDGGMQWDLAVPNWWQYSVHADEHDMVIIGNNMYLATDGGLYKGNIHTEEWEDIENIPTTQFYRVGYNPHEPNIYYGGAQDNGTTSGNSSTFNEWDRIYGADGFQVTFDPSDPNIIYAETQNGGIVASFNGGQGFGSATGGILFNENRNWDMPFFVSSHNPKVLFTGTQRVYVNYNSTLDDWIPISNYLTNFGNEHGFFSQNISAIDQSPINENLIYVGTSDGLVWRTKDFGQSWEDISEGVPLRYMSSIKASPESENTLYLTITGYKSNDFTPYIYKSEDNGDNWQSIQGNLPQIAINDVYILPENDDQVIFAGTDGGVYFTIDGGIFWERLGDNMPIVPIYDMEYNYVNNQLIAATFARSIQTFDLVQVGIGLPSSTTSIEGKIAFSVFPTLTNSNIQIETEVALITSVNIFNMSGKLMISGKECRGNSQCQIDVSKFPLGTYLVEVLTPNGRGVSKIMVAK